MKMRIWLLLLTSSVTFALKSITLNEKIHSVSLGSSHTLAILRSFDKLYSWGNNEYGQLGCGTTESKSTPSLISMPGIIKQASASPYHSIALTSDGKVWQWGRILKAWDPELIYENVLVPSLVGLLFDGVKVASGLDFCIVMARDGEVYGWGANNLGQLGDSTREFRNGAVKLQSNARFVDICCGYYHCLALTREGLVFSWGSNEQGQLGIASPVPYSLVPMMIKNIVRCIKIAAGPVHSLALSEDGKIFSWGGNESGQLGNNCLDPSSVPILVDGPHYLRFTDVSAGGIADAHFNIKSHSAAVTNDGHLFTWGNNGKGQLGSGRDSSSFPIAVNINDISSVSCGGFFSAAISFKGDLFLWGANESGQLGNGSVYPSFLPILIFDAPFKLQFIDVAAGDQHVLALHSNGLLFSWGDNLSGQLGLGDYISRHKPTLISSLSRYKFVKIAVGSSHSLALTTDGVLFAWGSNSGGQLGLGTFASSKIPLIVRNFPMERVAEIAASREFSMILLNNGSVLTCGRNDFGILGINSSIGHLKQPYFKPTATNVKFSQISASSSHCLALGVDGSVYAWGSNLMGEQGNSDDSPVLLPSKVHIPRSLGKMIKVEARSFDHSDEFRYKQSVVLSEDGKIYIFGCASMIPERCQIYHTPTLFESELRFIGLYAGSSFTSVLSNDLHLLSWGNNSMGQLGIGTTESSMQPVMIDIPSSLHVEKVAAGKDFSVAVMEDGSLFSWGSNSRGQLGLDILHLSVLSPTAIQKYDFSNKVSE